MRPEWETDKNGYHTIDAGGGRRAYVKMALEVHPPNPTNITPRRFLWYWWTRDRHWQFGGEGVFVDCKLAAEKHIGLRPTAWERITS